MSDKADDIKPVPLANDIGPVRTHDGEPAHLISTHKKCPADPAHEGYDLRNYNEALRDGDIYCAVCGAYIRMYDAG